MDAFRELKRAEPRKARKLSGRKWGGGRRRQGSGGEVEAMAKMGCPEVGEPPGGLGSGGEALERCGDSRRRPALEVKRRGGARMEWGLK